MDTPKRVRPLSAEAYERGEGTKNDRAAMRRVAKSSLRLLELHADAVLKARDALVDLGVPVETDDDISSLLQRAQVIAPDTIVDMITGRLGLLSADIARRSKAVSAGRMGGKKAAEGKPRTRTMKCKAVFDRLKNVGLTDYDAINAGALAVSTVDHTVTTKAFRESLRRAGVPYDISAMRGRRS